MSSGAQATDARRAFLTGLIDDAGLFPPAELSMAAAVAGHQSNRWGPHGWVQGRFLCPAGRLDEFVAALPTDAADWPVVVVADGAELVGDVRAAMRLGERTGRRAVVTGMEVRLPVGPAESAVAEIVTTGDPSLGLALELPATSGPEAIDAWVRAIRGARSPASPAPVAKLRCGGPAAEAFPTVERVAAVIGACIEHGVALKATAGLHRPVRHHDPATGFDHHGFFNIFGALVLLASGAIDRTQVVAVLEEVDPSAFRLTESGFRWRHAVLDAPIVGALRDRLVVGYGSCSFDEPIGELVGMGVLAGAAR